MKRISIGGCCMVIIGVFCLFLSLVAFWQMGGFGSELERDLVILDRPVVLPENEGKLVAVIGDVTAKDEYIVDPYFGIKVKSPVLRRQVMMYQWDKDSNDDSYRGAWSGKLESGDVGYRNPGKFPYEDKKFFAELYLGEFKITEDKFQYVSTNNSVKNLRESEARKHGLTVINGDYQTPYTLVPRIGDVKITFKYADPFEGVTMIGKQKGNTIEEYVNVKGRKINELWFEKMNKAQIIEKFEDGDIMASVVCIVLTVIFLGGGIYFIRNKYKENA